MTSFELLCILFNDFSDYMIVVWGDDGFEIFDDDRQSVGRYLENGDDAQYDRFQHWIHKNMTWAELETILCEAEREVEDRNLYENIATVVSPIIYNMKYR